MKTRNHFGRTAIGPFVATAAIVTGTLLSAPTAMAQQAGLYEQNDPNVTVDMSVLEGGGRATAKSFPERYSGALIVPGPHAPESQLYVSPSPGGAALPAPEKGQPAMASPAGPALPPAKAPESTIATAPQSPPPVEPEPEPEQKPAAAPPPAPTVTAATPPAPPAPPKPAESAPPPKPEVAAATAEPAKPPAPPEEAATKPEPPAVEPPKADVAAAEPETQQKEQASLPPSGAEAEPGASVRVVFEAGASKLPEDSRDQLKALVESLSEKTNLRLQLLAYAGGESLSSSKARRLSLSRALSVRSYLIESGLRSTRIDVRALGNKTTDEPVNRVDINVIER